jgi:hypothetical protein
MCVDVPPEKEERVIDRTVLLSESVQPISNIRRTKRKVLPNYEKTVMLTR